jgi:hypothetical protein
VGAHRRSLAIIAGGAAGAVEDLSGRGSFFANERSSDKKAFNRRQLEVVAMLELAAAIKAGEMFVTGSLSYDRFWDRLPREAADPSAIAAYAASQGSTTMSYRRIT